MTSNKRIATCSKALSKPLLKIEFFSNEIIIKEQSLLRQRTNRPAGYHTTLSTDVDMKLVQQ